MVTLIPEQRVFGPFNCITAWHEEFQCYVAILDGCSELVGYGGSETEAEDSLRESFDSWNAVNAFGF